MAKQTQTIFLEEWLKSNSSSGSSRPSPPSSARAIIQAWAELRDALQHQTFQSNHILSLQTLLNSQTSLHVADPQAKLLLSILSSPHISLPQESHPLFLRLLYIWARKSSKPSPSLVESTVSFLSRFLSAQFDSEKSYSVVCEAILLLGALSLVPVLSRSSKGVCLELLCKLLEDEYRVIRSREELVPEVLAGIGYTLSSTDSAHFGKILDSLFGIWNKNGGPCSHLSHGLIILHLMEWVVSGSISSRNWRKIEFLCREIFGISHPNYAPFAVVMAAAGVLRAFNRAVSSGNRLEISAQHRVSAEECIEVLARNLVSKTGDLLDTTVDPNNRLLIQCISLGLSRSGSVSFRAPLLLCLASALLIEVFPLRYFYAKIAEYPPGYPAGLRFSEIKEHLNGVLFKEAGAITGVFCNQYSSADEETKRVVENLIWSYCHDMYSGHRQVKLVLRSKGKELIDDLEKIAEAAFLMVVVFASVVTKHHLKSKLPLEAQIEASVKILVSFSCVEYFRRIRLAEYTDTIRAVVKTVQEYDSACVSFVGSMPSYVDLTNQKGSSFLGKMEYIWLKDDVQTARILFYLRVIPTCMERVPVLLFRKLVAPAMFLYMGHHNGKVARASHSVFVAFVSSRKDSNQDDRTSTKEQLVFYYIQRSLEAYPAITPFEGMAAGVAALVRHLPGGSPSIFYCIHSLVEKAYSLCREALVEDANIWKNWQGDSESCKKVLELLLRLISLVDIQVLPNLMKLLSQFIVQLPKDGQDMVLGEIYSQVAESDDVTRKPTLVSWLQSLSYLCSEASNSTATTRGIESEVNYTDRNTDTLSLNRISSRL